MKTRFMLAALALVSLFSFAACSDDDDDKDVTKNDVPELYQAALIVKYPEATNVKWEKTAKYYIAEFQKPQQDYEVWFAAEAEWVMTEIDYGKNLFFVPAKVNEALAESKYGTNYAIDSVEEYQRTDRTFYIIEVEPMAGGMDEYLYFSPEGEMFKTTTTDVDITPDTQL